ncbi:MULTISPECIES: hypothetical protein [unclassified Crossiella]|uniref:hypothetical protein n=1 Tax=unclassified Crossiella TaxID=2620835 RepID=UPI001FFF4F77|nr:MULTISPECIES: hypothetical protein [unclassified Crossiella]MCK2238653.1 hypothetical protein [Crossiella sp. S99.2]MCK2251777.1 hypothetical protein [Crossiella sp. S99.1]
MRLLRYAALAEMITVAVLLLNLVTVHWRPVSALTGPLHGTAYLLVIAACLLRENTPPRTRLLALIPAIGGYLALRRLQQS